MKQSKTDVRQDQGILGAAHRQAQPTPNSRTSDPRAARIPAISTACPPPGQVRHTQGPRYFAHTQFTHFNKHPIFHDVSINKKQQEFQ